MPENSSPRPPRSQEAIAALTPNQGYGIITHALELEWKLFERQEKQAFQLLTLSLTLLSVFPTLYSLAFGAQWSIWESLAVGISMFCLALVLMFAWSAVALDAMTLQNPASLKRITVEPDKNGQHLWDSPQLERDRAIALTEIIESLNKRCAKVAAAQNKMLYCLASAVFFMGWAVVAGITQ
ncbi:hypothetical protein AB0O14_19205 [Microbacterium foliorum]|uniref:hypothetical protein n=1 Tax=Rothia terrae TaxID=396015 RepID=UPI00342B13B9